MGFFNETLPAGVDPGYYYTSMQPVLIGANTMYIVVCLLAMGLRLFVRLYSRQPLWWDDAFAFICGLLAVAISALNIVQLPNGFGRHDAVIMNTNPHLYTDYGRVQFFIMICYCWSLAFFKWSALAFYCRIFYMYRHIVWTSLALGVGVFIWVVITVCIQIFQCSPVRHLWDIYSEGTCWISQTQAAFVHSVPSIFFDAAILFLPVYRIWSLHLPRQKRIAAIGVFMLGGLVLIISFIRLSEVVKYDKHVNGPDPLFYQGVTVCIWSIAEPVAGLLSCCMATYWPLVRAALRALGIQTPGADEPSTNHQQPKSWLRWNATSNDASDKESADRESKKKNSSNNSKSGTEEIQEIKEIGFLTKPASLSGTSADNADVKHESV